MVETTAFVASGPCLSLFEWQSLGLHSLEHLGLSESILWNNRLYGSPLHVVHHPGHMPEVGVCGVLVRNNVQQRLDSCHSSNGTHSIVFFRLMGCAMFLCERGRVWCAWACGTSAVQCVPLGLVRSRNLPPNTVVFVCACYLLVGDCEFCDMLTCSRRSVALCLAFSVFLTNAAEWPCEEYLLFLLFWDGVRSHTCFVMCFL